MTHEQKPKTVYWLDDKLYLNITNRCSNQCIFCFKNFKRGVGGFTLKLDKEPSFEQITMELEEVSNKRIWKQVVFCGFGEPTEKLDLLLEVSKYVAHNRSRLMTIRLNTNGHGYVLNPGRDIAEELREAGVKRASVSLNSGNEAEYNEVCKPSFHGAFNAVLEFIKMAKEKLDTEVTAVAISEVDLNKVEEVTRQLGVTFRIRPCVPCFW